MPPSHSENRRNPEQVDVGLSRRFKSAASALALRLAGPLVGGRFLNALEESKRVQWLTPDELRGRGERQLTALLRHAAENVPFYRDHYRRQGLAPDELRTTEDLQALPVMTKSYYRRHPRSHFLAENVPAHRGLERSTSGSTGEPFRFTLDRQAMPLIFASHLFYDSWFGLNPFDRYVRIMAPPTPPSPDSRWSVVGPGAAKDTGATASPVRGFDAGEDLCFGGRPRPGRTGADPHGSVSPAVRHGLHRGPRDHRWRAAPGRLASQFSFEGGCQHCGNPFP